MAGWPLNIKGAQIYQKLRVSAPSAGKGAIPETPRAACASAALILALATPGLRQSGRVAGSLHPKEK